MKNICVSGGAEGSDLAWGEFAKKAGHDVIHISFKGHKTNAPQDEVITMSEAKLVCADPFLEKANVVLKRYLPYNKSWIINLLRRNYYQIKGSSSLYAIGFFKRNQIEGGTAWAIIMFQLEKPNLPLYFFDQNSDSWYIYTNNQWNKIDSPPKPTGLWTGVGSRELHVNGKRAIENLLK